MLSRHSVGTYRGNELTRNSSGNARPQLSRLAEPLWTDPGLKSEIVASELISEGIKVKKEKEHWRWVGGGGGKERIGGE